MAAAMQPQVSVRTALPEDAAICGQICYEAFAAINTTYGFALDFPGPEATTGLLSMMFSNPGWYGVIAQSGRRIVGSNAQDERSVICGVLKNPGSSRPDQGLFGLNTMGEARSLSLPNILRMYSQLAFKYGRITLF